jgi:hypothetical protein
MGGSVTVVSGGSLTVDASAINFGASSNIGALLSLTSGAGANLLFNNSNAPNLAGLQFGTVTLNSGSSAPFLLSGAVADGNGIGVVSGTSLNAGTINIKTAGAASITTANENFVVNQLNLTTTGAVNFSNNQTITVVADGTTGTGSNSGNGGTINISAQSLTGTGVTLSAPGGGAGTTGGTIVLTATGGSPLTIAPVVSNTGIFLDVSDAGGKASGSVTVANGGNLTVDGSAIKYLSTGGGSLSLTGANVLVSNVLWISTANLASVTLASSSNSAFTFGNVGLNGFADNSSPTLTATKVSISNAGVGGINTTGGVALNANSISLNAASAITIGSGLTALADSNGNGGTISVTAGLINAGGGYLLNAAGTTGAGGTVTVNIASTAALTVGSGGLTVDVANATGQAGGTVSITNGGAITADVSSASINLGGTFASGKGANLTLISTGAVLSLTNVSDIAGIGLGRLTFASNSTQAFALGGVTLGNNGIVDPNLNITAVTVSITNTGGAISNGNLASLGGTSSIALTAAGDIGASASPVVLSGTPALTLNTGGNAYVQALNTTNITNATVADALSVLATGGNLTVGGVGQSPLPFSTGSVAINYNNANAGNTNTVTVGTIATTNGDLNIASNARNLVVGDGTNAASLSSVNGNITLSNTDTNAGANILVNAGATIHGSGEIGNLAQGNVYIVMGAVPVNPVQGLAPTINPPTFIGTGGALVYFGTNSITTGASDVLQALGRNLVFNTGAFAGSAITLGQGVTITADPPAITGISQTGPRTINALNLPAAVASSVVPSVVSSVAAGGVTATNALITPVAASGILTAAINNLTVDTITAANGGVGGLPAINSGVSTLTGGVSNTAHHVLDLGPLLLSPEQNTVVETPYGSVSVAAGSVALIISSDKGLAVYDLHDGGKNAVVIRSGKDTVALMPGRSAVLTGGSVQSFDQANPIPIVAYRHVESKAVGDKTTLYQAEFDILSMVAGQPAIKHLMASSSPKTRKTMGNLLKTAAILMQLSQGSEAYSLYLTPSRMAFLSSAPQ